MKKTLAILACTVLAASLAGAEEVVSSNTVGYTKVALASGLNFVASQFVLVGGGDQAINEAATKLDGQVGYDDETFEPTTTLKLWNGSGYVTYGWSGNLLTDSPAMAEEMGITDDSLDNKWLNGDYEESEIELPTATGYWLKAQNAGYITYKGEVPGDDPVVLNLVAGLNMLSYPWPMDADMSKVSVAGQLGYDDETFEPRTTLKVWNGSGYVTYGWSGNLLADSPAMAEEMGVSDNSLDNKWLNGDYEVSEIPLALGHGFWIKSENAGTVTFTK